MSDLILSVDVGGTNLRLGLVRPDMSVEAFDIVRSAPVLETDAPLDALITIIQRFLYRHAGTTDGTGERTLGAVAVGFPSTVDVTRRVVLSTANIAALQNLPVVTVLESAFGVPVVIDRDVNFLLRHDIHDLGLTGLPVVACYLGTGLGNAIAIRGEILVGAHGVAGELGHIPVRGLQKTCGCGNTGCVETIASGIRLTEIANEHFGENLDTRCSPTIAVRRRSFSSSTTSPYPSPTRSTCSIRTWSFWAAE